MPYIKISDPFMGVPAIPGWVDGAASPYTGDATQGWTAFQVLLAQDVGNVLSPAASALGGLELIYLPGVALNVYGAVVIYDQKAATSKLAVAADRGPCAVSLGAVVAGSWGWFVVGGIAVLKEAVAPSAGNPVFLTATPGICGPSVVNTDKVDGMRWKTADGTPAAGYAYVELDRPACNGNG